MTTYRVVPSGTHWDVEKGNGAVVSTHRKKSRAVSNARRQAGPGDIVEVRRADGTIQKRVG